MTGTIKNTPSGWAATTFGSIADYVNGRCFKSSEWEKSGLPIIRIQNLNNEDAGFNYSNRVFEDKYLVRNGDLLFSWSASLGVYIWKGGDAWLNQHIFRVVPYRIEKEYLYYCLEHHLDQLSKKTHGQGMVHITKGKFESHSILLPPIEEQLRIVAKIEELLSELDKGIESLKTAREQLKVYRQALLKHAFEGKLTEQWRRDNVDKLESAAQLLERIEQEREARYQRQLEEWEAAVMQWEVDGKEGKKPTKPKKYSPTILSESERLRLVVNGTSQSWVNFSELLYSIRGGTTTPPTDSVTEFPILRSSSVRNGTIDYKDIRYLTEVGVKTDQDFVNTGDLLFSRLNGTIDYVGNCALVKSGYPSNLLYPDRLYGAKLVDASLGAYCEYFFASPIARKHIEDKAKSTAGHKRISIPDITELPLPLTSTEEMKEVVSILDKQLSVVVSYTTEIESSLKRAEALRQSILKKAFSGKLVPQDPDDESASSLLDRIAKGKEDALAAAQKTRKKTGSTKKKPRTTKINERKAS